MLTLQTFLHKFKKTQFDSNVKKNMKYCALILCYAIVFLFLVSKNNFYRLGTKQQVFEAFAQSTQQFRTYGEEKNFSSNEILQRQLDLYAEDGTSLITNQDESTSNQEDRIAVLSADIYTEIVPQKEEKVAESKEISIAAEDQNVKKDKLSTEKASLSLASAEVSILERIVEAEATGEDIKGKILVANVIMNRVKDKSFPDSIQEVVFQKTGDTYQFSPIRDKRYWSVNVTIETKEAVQRVIRGEDYSQGALYFSARSFASKANMKWFDNNLKRLFEYGGHEFFTHK